MKRTSTITSGIVTTAARTSPWLMLIPKTVKKMSCESIRSGTLVWEPPSQSRPTFCRMNEKPTAVINGASLGAFRNGL